MDKGIRGKSETNACGSQAQGFEFITIMALHCIRRVSSGN
jgi:hypothetical protein